MFSGAELQNARFENPGHPYPELICAGLKELWVGPRYSDFDPRLMAAVGRHLGKHKLPKARADQLHWINNRIRGADWTALEIAWEEGKAHVEGAQQKRAEKEAPPRLDELSEFDRRKAMKAIKRGRQATRQPPSATDDEK
ncbi:hypothetical protein [Vacuolonema iberomarrocanum]|uniref:hypothetical protein n=1 Tax=Vacuolonema iberomarrocanum TaxID=3454632 RepID=UPI001A098072|nr:hypothetical protein [filamentous cyanobacterium LEGE 07170]